jgi:hypothetical protein
MTGTNFSSWYRADEGTLYAEGTAIGVSASPNFMSISDNTANNAILLRCRASGVTSNPAVVLTNGAVVTTLANATFTTSNKNSFSYATNDFASSLNGGSVAIDTSGTLPIVNRAYIGSGETGTSTSATIKKISYYPKRLTNAELQGLTTV